MEAKTDRRIKRTRYLLVHALTSLMLKKSIKDITVKELCESVDINRGTFYLHYKDIYDMLEQTEQELLEQFEQVFKNYHPDHTPDFPYPLFVEIFQIIDQNSDLCCALLSPNGDISFSVKKLIAQCGKLQSLFIKYQISLCGKDLLFSHWSHPLSVISLYLKKSSMIFLS